MERPLSGRGRGTRRRAAPPEDRDHRAHRHVRAEGDRVLAGAAQQERDEAADASQHDGRAGRDPDVSAGRASPGRARSAPRASRRPSPSRGTPRRRQEPAPVGEEPEAGPDRVQRASAPKRASHDTTGNTMSAGYISRLGMIRCRSVDDGDGRHQREERAEHHRPPRVRVPERRQDHETRRRELRQRVDDGDPHPAAPAPAPKEHPREHRDVVAAADLGAAARAARSRAHDGLPRRQPVDQPPSGSCRPRARTAARSAHGERLHSSGRPYPDELTRRWRTCPLAAKISTSRQPASGRRAASDRKEIYPHHGNTSGLVRASSMTAAAEPGSAWNVVLSICTVSAMQLSCPRAWAAPGIATIAAIAVMIASARNLFTCSTLRVCGLLLPHSAGFSCPIWIIGIGRPET